MGEKTEKLKRTAGGVAGKVGSFVSEKTVSEESKLWAALCYILAVLLPLVVLLTEKKKDRYVAFHAYQSLILFAATIIYFIFLGIAGFVFDIFPGCLGVLLIPLYFVPLVVFLISAWNAYKGRKFKLPVLGDMAEKAM